MTTKRKNSIQTWLLNAGDKFLCWLICSKPPFGLPKPLSRLQRRRAHVVQHSREQRLPGATPPVNSNYVRAVFRRLFIASAIHSTNTSSLRVCI